MKKLLFILCPFILLLAGSCHYEKTYYHNKHGKIKHVRAARTPPWFETRERGYNKRARRVMHGWDRGVAR